MQTTLMHPAPRSPTGSSKTEKSKTKKIDGEAWDYRAQRMHEWNVVSDQRQAMWDELTGYLQDKELTKGFYDDHSKTKEIETAVFFNDTTYGLGPNQLDRRLREIVQEDDNLDKDEKVDELIKMSREKLMGAGTSMGQQAMTKFEEVMNKNNTQFAVQLQRYKDLVNLAIEGERAMGEKAEGLSNTLAEKEKKLAELHSQMATPHGVLSLLLTFPQEQVRTAVKSFGKKGGLRKIIGTTNRSEGVKEMMSQITTAKKTDRMENDNLAAYWKEEAERLKTRLNTALMDVEQKERFWKSAVDDAVKMKQQVKQIRTKYAQVFAKERGKNALSAMRGKILDGDRSSTESDDSDDELDEDIQAVGTKEKHVQTDTTMAQWWKEDAEDMERKSKQSDGQLLSPKTPEKKKSGVRFAAGDRKNSSGSPRGGAGSQSSQSSAGSPRGGDLSALDMLFNDDLGGSASDGGFPTGSLDHSKTLGVLRFVIRRYALTIKELAVNGQLDENEEITKPFINEDELREAIPGLTGFRSETEVLQEALEELRSFLVKTKKTTQKLATEISTLTDSKDLHITLLQTVKELKNQARGLHNTYAEVDEKHNATIALLEEKMQAQATKLEDYVTDINKKFQQSAFTSTLKKVPLRKLTTNDKGMVRYILREEVNLRRINAINNWAILYVKLSFYHHYERGTVKVAEMPNEINRMQLQLRLTQKKWQKKKQEVLLDRRKNLERLMQVADTATGGNVPYKPTQPPSRAEQKAQLREDRARREAEQAALMNSLAHKTGNAKLGNDFGRAGPTRAKSQNRSRTQSPPASKKQRHWQAASRDRAATPSFPNL
eukprot:TRINITY_DN51451_c0_g1_i1.p1 TRINITY_DN51451_c0_g1~~TRINITY_DN51451_c0_g1_i1.p1  ORF type:complete len:829 (-),score=133.37 TRINITY_DN51451_c0_g1_i1:62-2548(-)